MTRPRSNVCSNITRTLIDYSYASLNQFTKWYYRDTKPFKTLPHYQGITSLEILFGKEGKDSTAFANQIYAATAIALNDKSKKCSLSIGPEIGVVIFDPADIEDLFLNHENDITSQESIPLFERYFGNVIMKYATENPKWKPLRNKFVDFVLHPKATQHNTKIIQEIAQETIEKSLKNKSFSLEDTAAIFTIEVILRALLNIKNTPDEDKLKLAKLISSGVDEAVKIKNVALMTLPVKIELESDRIVKQGKKFVDEKLLSPHEKIIQNSHNWITEKLNSESKEEKIHSDHVLQDILFLLTAGHDTTATHFLFTLSLVLKHPDVLKNIYQEIISLKKEPKDWNFDDFKKMIYLDCVTLESLRCLEPLPIQKVRAKNNFTFKDGTEVKKDTQIYINVHATHRNEKMYPKPNEFKPERFKDYKIDAFMASSFEKDFPFRYGWMPFGTGSRMCVGRKLAIQEVKVFLAYFVYYFQPTLENDWNFETKTTFGMSPKTDKPLTVGLKRR